MPIVDSCSSPTPWTTSLLGLALLVAGCTYNVGIIDTDPDVGLETTTNGDGDGDDGESGDSADTDEPWQPIPARGDIALTEVVVNQGVDVPIAVDGVWVGPTERNTFVVANRDTLLRGFWEIPEDWVAREITAVLDLRYPDGTEVQMMDTKMIDGPSFAGDLDRGFIFQLLAEQFPSGLQYHMTLWEAGPGAEAERESTSVIESPIGGLQLVGAQPEPAELKIVVMPVAYNNGNGCNTNTADPEQLTPEQEMRFLNYMHEQYPVHVVHWDFRRDTPIQWNTQLNSLAELWEPLQGQRAEDNADPNVYYYALVDVCGGGIDDAAGIAPGLATDTKAAAFERVSSGIWNQDEYSYHVMVHEIGHNHGRAHVYCANGDAAGVDPSYPYEDGVIGVWGFGIRLFQLHSPTATRDIMTYCAPNWVSDWGWSKAFNRVRTLTSWDYEAPGEPEPPSEVLIGLVLENGTERWWTTPGGRELEHFSSGESIEFDYGDAVIASPTNVQILDDGTTMITTMVPRPNAGFVGATRKVAGEIRAIDL